MTKLHRFLGLAALAVAALPLTASAHVPVSDSAPTPSADPYPETTGRLIVQFAPSVAPAFEAAEKARSGEISTGEPTLDSLLRFAGTRSVESFLARAPESAKRSDERGLDRVFILEMDKGADVREMERMFERNPLVETAVPEVYITQTAVPNDPDYGDNWGFDNTVQLQQYTVACPLVCGVNVWPHCGANVGTAGFDSDLPKAWDSSAGYGDPSVVIAILDDGVDVDHPDLNCVAGWDYIDGDSDPDAVGSAAHGTGCAGVAAGIANNGIGVTGVAGGCSIMPVRIGTNVDVTNGLDFARTNGADVISMSFHFDGWSVGTDPFLDAALQAALDADILLLASSGNDGISNLWIPAVHPAVMAIGAADPCGTRKKSNSCDGELWTSSYGVNTQDAAGAVSLLAPTMLPSTDTLGGDGVCSGDYNPWFNGTSCSCPFAAGVAALLRSAYPDWTAAEVRARMEATATDMEGSGWDRETGYGLVNAGAALAQPDWRPYQHTGWADTVVPRETNDGAITNVPAPANLVGDIQSTYFNWASVNFGNGASLETSNHRIFVDGVSQGSFNVGAGGPNGVFWYLNNVARTIPGGLHSVENIVDWFDASTELNEGNNADGAQWVWTPQALALDSENSRTGPPNGTAGWATIPGINYINQDGVRIPSGFAGFFYGVAQHAQSNSDDYDIRMYQTASGPTHGFRNGSGDQILTSNRNAGRTDLIFINERNVGGFVYDVGLVNASGGSSNSRTEWRNNPILHTVDGATNAFSLDAHQMLDVYELNVITPGRVTIDLVSDGAAQRMRVLVFDPSITYAEFDDAIADAWTDDSFLGTDRTALDLDLAAGIYPIAVYRDPVDGTAALSGSIRFRATPADLRPYTWAGAHGPLVPADGNLAAVCSPWPTPPSLTPDGASQFNYKIRNHGPNASVAGTTRITLDGVTKGTFSDGALNPTIVNCRTNTVANSQGGRHTFAMEVDINDANEELYPDNNHAGEQWVWAPATMAQNTAYPRADAPDPIGGHALITAGPALTNVDGMRTENLVPAPNDDGFFTVVAATPLAGGDVDLYVHPLSTGVQDGFGTLTAFGNLAGSGTEILVIDVDGAQGGALGARDIGIRRWIPSASGYTIQTSPSTWLNGTGSNTTNGTYTIPAGQNVRMFERAYATSSPNIRVQVRNLSGNADLMAGLVIRDGSGYYNFFDLILSNSGGPGQDEFLDVPVFGSNEIYGIVVWKPGESELAKDAEFELYFGDPGATDTPTIGEAIERTGITAVAPNPFSPFTSVKFDIKRNSQVDVTVYDTTGRLVRRLESGIRPAGRYETRWNGRDDSGRSVASGVYFIRMDTDDHRESRKVIRLH